MPEPAPQGMNPAALPIPLAAQLLSRAAGRLVTEQMLRDDVAAGAPANPDGTLNLVHYGAWVVRENSGRTDGD